ncbi:hypothetical protein, conserved [Entamoeba dispar SAW760]|uniref:tRNA:m(4)X modification enzyme TRM13 n=1 Tax=Entamoeba dispar (strain ATCC PRA-260 / SAW760) TaxID=370354 RepID=B0EFD3_ENTDS|nr:uncharacterized protein EDI_260090 [Entamoeba dispar SAW760]EDR26763.1 hypothetical protein, conserved [Entamoeba dispar SAW760]|eukprot:EDR26763.1 hypothetical protein, conserved [Entamoeba dispar SAW760]
MSEEEYQTQEISLLKDKEEEQKEEKNPRIKDKEEKEEIIKKEINDRKEYYKKKNSETVICPFNSEHIIKKRKYLRHIRGCPNNPTRKATYGKKYIVENINRPIIKESITKEIEIKRLLPFLEDKIIEKGIDKERKGSEFIRCECNKLTLSQFGEEEIKIMKERVKIIYNYMEKKYTDIFKGIKNNIEKEGKEDELIEEKEIKNIEMPEGWEFQSEKHSKQCISIIKHLIDKKIIINEGDKKQNIIESGAGTGMLSAYYSLIPHSNNTRIYLIDRMTGLRKKYDRFSKRNGDQITRIAADLSDIDLNQLIDEIEINDKIKTLENSTTIIGKHLCGSATDMALRMAISLTKTKRLRGIGIALCCHFKGDGHDDCTIDFFNTLGVRISELTLIHRMAAWGISLNNSNEKTDDLDKKLVGQMCRSILNVARVVWLKNQTKCIIMGKIKYD